MTNQKEDENFGTIVVAEMDVRINWIWEQFKALKSE
jgi:hypothetical protein